MDVRTMKKAGKLYTKITALKIEIERLRNVEINDVSVNFLETNSIYLSKDEYGGDIKTFVGAIITGKQTILNKLEKEFEQL